MQYAKCLQCFIQWLKDDFIGYLDDWETSVRERPGFSRAEQNNMLLSPETRLGLRTTGMYASQENYTCKIMLYNFFLPVKSFVALVQFVFTIPGVNSFLSEKLCQDPLEKFLGCQRQRGGVNENPTVNEFCKNTQALRVVNSLCQNVSQGNCRGKRPGLYDGQENTPLLKRRIYHK